MWLIFGFLGEVREKGVEGDAIFVLKYIVLYLGSAASSTYRN